MSSAIGQASFRAGAQGETQPGMQWNREIEHRDMTPHERLVRRGDMMFDTAFISSRMDMHPASVDTAVAEWHRSLPPVAGARTFVRLGRRLWLATQPQLVSSDPLQLYAVRGILWINGWPIRVILECSMWSATVSQVAIRPAHLSWPVRSGSYWSRAAAVLDDVIGSLAAPTVVEKADVPEGQRAVAKGAPVRVAA
jgi:hypothetical protein